MFGRNVVDGLRKIALIEAASFIVLLFIAMPLKYWADQPGPVRVVGMVHGVLFVGFVIAWGIVVYTARWPVGRAAGVFLAALLPFGPFLMDRRMKAYEQELGQ